jgi:hypothetical protein
VPFLLVPVEDMAHLKVQGLVALWQTLLQIFVDGGFGYPEVACGRADGRAGFDDVHSQLAGSLLDCV